MMVLLGILCVALNATVVGLALIYSRDMKQLANGLQNLIETGARDSHHRENEVWLRAQKEIELQRRFLDDMHRLVLGRVPQAQRPVQAEVTPAPREATQRPQKPRADRDLATMGT